MSSDSVELTGQGKVVGKSPNSRPVLRWEVVRRFTAAGASVGLLVGICEAVFLHTTPHTPALQEPDVQYVVFFLAPLVNLAGFGVLGLGLGVAAAWGRSANPWRISSLLAAGLGVTGAFVASLVQLHHVGLRRVVEPENLPLPLACCFGVFALALPALKLSWSRLAPLFSPKPSRLFGHMARILFWTMAIAVAGLISFLATESSRLASAHDARAKPGRQPNIVLISLDTVRADHLSTYGYPRPTTPHIDRLAGQGVLFENAFSPASWTLPSHAAMFTELLPHQHGADWFRPLDAGPSTLAEVLRSLGYETAGFNSNLYYGQKGWGLAQGFEIYEDNGSSLRHNLAATHMARVLFQPLYERFDTYDALPRRNAGEVNRGVLRWFRQRSTRPFFLFINYFDAHEPYFAPPPYDRRFGQVPDAVQRKVRPMIDDEERFPWPLTEEEKSSLIAGYDNCLAYLDSEVGQLLRFLADSPGWSHTVVIITSDHGESFGEHGRYSHGRDLYRETLQVPLIILGPGIPAGLRIPHIARIREIFPTILGFALDHDSSFARYSLCRYWTPGFRPEPFDEMVVSELNPFFHETGRPLAISLMTAEWHYLHHSSGRRELYRWPTDPEESLNLSELPEYEGTLQALHQQLYEYVGLSFRPWHGPEYLFALDRPPDYSYLLDTTFGLKLQTSLPPHLSRVGACQAVLAPAHPAPRQLQPEQRDLIKSLPYQ